MLNSKEKDIMKYIYKVSKNKKSVLIKPSQIIVSQVPKYDLDESEVSACVNNLALDRYIDVVTSDAKGKIIYCVNLRAKGIAFERELMNKRKELRLIIARTVALAFLSFIIGLILRGLFF